MATIARQAAVRPRCMLPLPERRDGVRHQGAAVDAVAADAGGQAVFQHFNFLREGHGIFRRRRCLWPGCRQAGYRHPPGLGLVSGMRCRTMRRPALKARGSPFVQLRTSHRLFAAPPAARSEFTEHADALTALAGVQAADTNSFVARIAAVDAASGVPSP
jgi:hypothetical protein